MILLGIDTSGKNASAAIYDSSKELFITSLSFCTKMTHSQVILPLCNEALQKANLSLDDIDEIAAAVGPGSYTGVRISITIAKTIAYSLGIKVYAKSSLSLLKDSKKPTICLFNARSGRSYFAVYEGTKVLVSDCVKTNEEVLDYISKHKEYIVNGDTYQIGMESGQFDILENLVDYSENELVENIFQLNPVYLKELGK